MSMKISSIIDANEKRVAIIPDTVKKYIALGFEIVLPKDFGKSAGFSDNDYISAGAKITNEPVSEADIYLCVHPTLSDSNYQKIKKGAHLIALLSPFQQKEVLDKMAGAGINLYALEKVPRITRAQSMDVLSSQANIAGYKAMLDAMSIYGRVIPMMMTAAGTIRPAKVMILGAGVAGLQAIATAKRFGAIVSANDVRASAKEQVESLGASFISMETANAESSDGYAKEMSEEDKKRQQEKLAQIISSMDIILTTAQIPGKLAPRLVTKQMIETMSSGTVIVDMATETGGNCELSEKDKIVSTSNGVIIVGYTDFPARVATDSSRLFAKNVLNFVTLMLKDGSLNLEDEIIKTTKIS